MCRICYSTSPNDFDLSSNSAINIGIVGGQVCIINMVYTLEWLENDHLRGITFSMLVKMLAKPIAFNY